MNIDISTIAGQRAVDFIFTHFGLKGILSLLCLMLMIFAFVYWYKIRKC